MSSKDASARNPSAVARGVSTRAGQLRTIAPVTRTHTGRRRPGARSRVTVVIADDCGRSCGEHDGVDISELNAALGDPVLDSMNFLNEVAARFPQAVSFASGRPCEDFFAFDDLERCLRRYREFLTADRGYSEAQVVNTLFQYGRTKGIIHREIARYLETDEGIAVDPESIVVTVGAQEGMYLVARALCRDERDAALVVSPAYVGFIGAAKLAGMPVLPVAGGPRGIDLEDLRRQVGEARRRGLRPRTSRTRTASAWTSRFAMNCCGPPPRRTC
jgi:hypothetical protein